MCPNGSNGSNWVRMDPTGYKLVLMGQNGSKWVEIGRKRLKMSGTDFKKSKQVQTGPNRPKMVEKLSKIVQNCPNCQKLPNG